MFNQPGHQGQPPKGPAHDMQGGFATSVAFMIAMLAAPALSEATLPYVRRIALASYPPDLVWLFEIAWWVATFPLVFFAARASVATAITVAGVYLASRLI